MATTPRAAERLDVHDRGVGAGSRLLLRQAGLKRGMQVAELGCDTGAMTCWLAREVGIFGRAVGVDASPEQLALARARSRQLARFNLDWVHADLQRTGLPPASFDLVYCRVALEQMASPALTIREMHRILRVGGTLCCEEAVRAERSGRRWRVARRLYHLVRDAGFRALSVTSLQPLDLDDDPYADLSFQEIGARMHASDSALGAALDQAGDDGACDVASAACSAMTQVWATK